MCVRRWCSLLEHGLHISTCSEQHVDKTMAHMFTDKWLTPTFPIFVSRRLICTLNARLFCKCQGSVKEIFNLLIAATSLWNICAYIQGFPWEDMIFHIAGSGHCIIMMTRAYLFTLFILRSYFFPSHIHRPPNHQNHKFKKDFLKLTGDLFSSVTVLTNKALSFHSKWKS